jgi:hypothetical protein
MSDVSNKYYKGSLFGGSGKKVTKEMLTDFYTNYANAPQKIDRIGESLQKYKDKHNALVKALCDKYPDARHFWEISEDISAKQSVDPAEYSSAVFPR